MTEASQPLVSVVIPALNEQRDIAGCIDAIGAQDWPPHRMEVVLVDGCSDDRTVDEAKEAAARHHFARFAVFENPRRRTSTSLNVGLEACAGDFVVRIDARSRIQTDYVRRCVELLRARPDVAVVGGGQVAQARGDDLVEVAIARALRNRIGTGLSRYRRSSVSGPTDTVWMGAFRTADLRDLRGWADDVALNEDWDLNSRFRAAGKQVWFDHELRSTYLPRKTLGALAKQYFYFGRVKGMWWARGQPIEPRQAALVSAPLIAALVARKRSASRLAPAVALALLAIDAAGVREPAPLAERFVAAVATAVIGGAWWAGVVAGWAGEHTGVGHRHA